MKDIRQVILLTLLLPMSIDIGIISCFLACPFILGRNYKNSNVPLDITMANLTSFNWSTHADIGRKISLDELVVSSMTADSQWFSVAIRDGASKNSPIVVFNLDVVSQVLYNDLYELICMQ
jgi:hypothetical protein